MMPLALLREWLWWLGREGSWNPGERRWRYGPLHAWEMARQMTDVGSPAHRYREGGAR